MREIDGRIPVLGMGRRGDLFVPTGVNRDRLWLHYHYLPTADHLDEERWHIPPFVWMMEALETCHTLTEVERLLHDVQRTDGMMLWAVDGTTDEGAIFECGHVEFARRGLVDGWMVGTNHHILSPDPDGGPGDERLSSGGRFARLEEMVAPLAAGRHRGDIVAPLIATLADDDIERRDPSFATVYANVACPATGEIWYTLGGWPAASRGDWQRVPWPWPDDLGTA